MEIIYLYAKEALIIILFLIVSILWRKNVKLKKQLVEEQKKRSFPLLSFEKNEKTRRVDIVNESYCYAQHINIYQSCLTVDYGFPVKLILKFEPIEMLKPNQRVPLEFKVFNKDHDITDENAKHVLYLYSDENLDINLSFENLENSRFESKIGYHKGEFYFKEQRAQD